MRSHYLRNEARLRRGVDDEETSCAASHHARCACAAASRFASECFRDSVETSGGFSGARTHALINIERRAAHAFAAAVLAHNIDDMPTELLAPLDGDAQGF